MFSPKDMRFHCWGFDTKTNPRPAEVLFSKQHRRESQKYCFNQAVLFNSNYNRLMYGDEGTSAIRGTQVLNGRKCFWQIVITTPYYRDSTQIGIATDKAKLQSPEFKALLGQDKESWAVSHSGELSHNGNVRKGYISDTIWRSKPINIWGVYFDGHKGILKFYLNGIDLGPAFHGLEQVESNLYPVISTCAPGLQATLVAKRINFDSLKDRCRAVILQQIPRDYFTRCPCEYQPIKSKIDELPVPPLVREYLKDELASISPGHKDILPIYMDCPEPHRLGYRDYLAFSPNYVWTLLDRQQAVARANTGANIDIIY